MQTYDLLNSRIHIMDTDLELDEGLMPRNLAQGNIGMQFLKLAEHAEIKEMVYSGIMTKMLSESDNVKNMITASFLDDAAKTSYWQSYSGRLKQLLKT